MSICNSHLCDNPPRRCRPLQQPCFVVRARLISGFTINLSQFRWFNKENLQHWLTDEKGRDQFVIRAGSDTEVSWNDAIQVKADPVYKRSFWTKSFVQWSPMGTYLATVHPQGAAVWGGASTFNHLMRYAHPQLMLLHS